MGNYVPNAYGDMEFVSQPNKVPRIEISYARTAKIINIRRLKSAMWNFLETTLSNPEHGSNQPQASPQASTISLDSLPHSDGSNPVVEIGSKLVENIVSENENPNENAQNFTELIHNLSNRISWQMANELSVSIILNCLLHLSNEKVWILFCFFCFQFY